ncbi:MAG: hypothetical protein QW253_02325 [Metallosphaera sp.]|uniref:hypothetical protein n=1 Tax=Desulfurococcus sp. TaxID=51678 RepID=UPI00316330BC
MSIDWLDSLNYMNNFIQEFDRAFRTSASLEPLEIYEQSALTCFYSAYKEGAYRKVLSNPLLEGAINACGRFIGAANRLSSTAQSMSGQTILYSIKRIENFTKISKKKTFLILCDCLSLPEYTLIFTEFADKVSFRDMFFMINPGGKTKTFEFLAENYLNVDYSKEPSLEDIANGLARKLNCSEQMLFRDMDRLIHKFEKVGFTSIRSMVETFYESISRLVARIKALSTSYTVLLLTDHGYDVMLKNGRIYPYHKWSREPSLSIIAPALILG